MAEYTGGKMFLRKSIKIPLYAGFFDIIVMDETKTFDKLYISEFARKEIYGHSIHTGLRKTQMTHFVMVLNFNNNIPITNGVVSHEALHITSFILDYIGQDFDHNNHEEFAYLIQWVTDEVYKFLKQQNLEPRCKP